MGKHTVLSCVYMDFSFQDWLSDTNPSLFSSKEIHARVGEQYFFIIYDLEGKNILKMLNDFTATWSLKFSDMLLSYWVCGGFVL